ncbi:hypothetical protein [Streptomyces sp. Wb2n-11]|uniref:hypothetical protein n=1 Tax=Streptomyces sp. Wb2n-11 TaxID=1030533 RepID=UPI000AF275E5|nr:hypothetical protein [Streptomyces sp. Wb2n-11]
MATATEAPASVTAEGPTSHTQNQADALAKLREPFQPNQISKLPKIWCGKCSKSQYKVCDDHTRERCDVCAGKMTSAHLHLDYVGHAELTGRLLEADPLWTWEPMAFDADGLPKFDQHGGLWIRLTVAGHTRLGYGDAQEKTGPNAVKEAIGDALRNAGMRFGAALTLWSKTDMDEADAQKKNLSTEPSREDRLEDLYGLMQKRWGHLGGMRALKVMVGEESFHESQVRDPAGQLRLFGQIIDDRILELLDQEKTQKFMSAARSGWNDLAATEKNLEDARAKKLLDVTIPFGTPETPTRIEDLLVTRIAELKGKPNEPSATATSEQGAAGSDPIDHLMSQVQNHWADFTELTKTLAEAGRRNQLAREVEGPLGTQVQFGAMVTARIAELKAMAQKQAQDAEQAAHTRDSQRSAA